MGVGLWMIAGAAAWIAARFVPAGRAGPAEAVAALVAAAAGGAGATALDFGGWNEPDWRAALFAFFCAAAGIAMVRVARLAGSRAAS